jgi:hypothetical protein
VVNGPDVRSSKGIWGDVVTASEKKLWDVVTTSTRTGGLDKLERYLVLLIMVKYEKNMS